MKTKVAYLPTIVEMDLFDRHLVHSRCVLDAIETSDWDKLIEKALSLEASIAALRHWVMTNRMGIKLDDTVN